MGKRPYISQRSRHGRSGVSGRMRPSGGSRLGRAAAALGLSGAAGPVRRADAGRKHHACHSGAPAAAKHGARQRAERAAQLRHLRGQHAFRLRHGPAAGTLRLACGAAGPLRWGAGSLSFVCGRGTWMEAPARISPYPSPERAFPVFKHHKNSSAAQTKSPKNVIIAYCQKRQRSKRKVRKKAGGGKAMHLCAAKCRPRGERRQKGGGDRARRRVSER